MPKRRFIKQKQTAEARLEGTTEEEDEVKAAHKLEMRIVAIEIGNADIREVQSPEDEAGRLASGLPNTLSHSINHSPSNGTSTQDLRHQARSRQIQTMSKHSGTPATRTEQGSSQGEDTERDEIAASAETHVSARTLIKLEHSNLRSPRRGRLTGRRSSKGVGTDTTPDQEVRDGSDIQSARVDATINNSPGVGRLAAKQYVERPSALKQYNLNVNINAVSPRVSDMVAALCSNMADQSIFGSRMPGAKASKPKSEQKLGIFPAPDQGRTQVRITDISFCQADKSPKQKRYGSGSIKSPKVSPRGRQALSTFSSKKLDPSLLAGPSTTSLVRGQVDPFPKQPTTDDATTALQLGTAPSSLSIEHKSHKERAKAAPSTQLQKQQYWQHSRAELTALSAGISDCFPGCSSNPEALASRKKMQVSDYLEDLKFTLPKINEKQIQQHKIVAPLKEDRKSRQNLKLGPNNRQDNQTASRAAQNEKDNSIARKLKEKNYDHQSQRYSQQIDSSRKSNSNSDVNKNGFGKYFEILNENDATGKQGSKRKERNIAGSLARILKQDSNQDEVLLEARLRSGLWQKNCANIGSGRRLLSLSVDLTADLLSPAMLGSSHQLQGEELELHSRMIGYPNQHKLSSSERKDNKEHQKLHRQREGNQSTMSSRKLPETTGQMSKSTIKQIQMQKHSMQNLARNLKIDLAMQRESIKNFYFSESIYGESDMLKDIHKIAQKRQRKIERMERIKQEEEFYGVPKLKVPKRGVTQSPSKKMVEEEELKSSQSRELEDKVEREEILELFGCQYQDFRQQMARDGRQGSNSKSNSQMQHSNPSGGLRVASPDQSELIRRRQNQAPHEHPAYESPAAGDGSKQSAKGMRGDQYRFDGDLHMVRDSSFNESMRQKQGKFIVNMNIVDNGLNQILKEEQESYLKWKKEDEIVQGHLRAQGLTDAKKKRIPHSQRLMHEQLSLIKDGLISMVARRKAERLSPQPMKGASGWAKRSPGQPSLRSSSDLAGGRAVDSQALVRKLSSRFAHVCSDPKSPQESLFDLTAEELAEFGKSFMIKDQIDPRFFQQIQKQATRLGRKKNNQQPSSMIGLQTDTESPALSNTPSAREAIDPAVASLRAIRQKIHGLRPSPTRSQYHHQVDQFTPREDEVFNRYEKQVLASLPGPRPQNSSQSADMISSTLLSKYLEETMQSLSGSTDPKSLASNQNQFSFLRRQKTEILKQAQIETGDLELFEYSQINASSLVTGSSQSRDAINKKQLINQYLHYLTSGQIQNEIVFKFGKQIRTKIQKDLIAEFNQKSMTLIDSLVFDILQRRDFMDLGKNQEHNPEAKQSPIRTYFNSCSRDQSLALPILQKIFDYKLILIDYQMNGAVCKALAEGFKASPAILRELHLDNCGFSDEENAIILQGAGRLQHFMSLVMMRQEFGQLSVSRLERILSKSFPNQLQELKIIRCKVSRSDLELLLDSLLMNSYLRNLVLVGTNFSAVAVDKLCKFIDENYFLKQLDLSWNELAPRKDGAYRPLLECLARNQSLEEINLSQNQICIHNPAASKEELEASQNSVIESLKQLLINDQCLMHLLLVQCGLSFEVLEALMPYIRLSPSLLSVHLSNNPGITGTGDQGVEYSNLLGRRLGLEAEDRNDSVVPDFIVTAEHDGRAQASTQQSTAAEPSDKGLLSSMNRELIQARRILREKDQQTSYLCFHDRFQDSAAKGSSSKFLLQRVLGFDDELYVRQSKPKHDGWRQPSKAAQSQNKHGINSKQKSSDKRRPSEWQLATDSATKCWVCDRYIYSLIFWNKSIGHLKRLDVKNSKQIIESLARFPGETDRPILYSETNGWDGQELHTVSEFCFIIDRRKPAELQELPLSELKDCEFNPPLPPDTYSHSRGDHQPKTLSQKLWDQLQHYKKTQVLRDVINKNLEFRDPQFINTQALCLFHMEGDITTYILPQFLKAGKFSYVIEYPQGEFYFHKALVHYRKEQMPLKLVDVGECQNALRDSRIQVHCFDRRTSLFAEWPEDAETAARIEQACQHDLRNLNFANIVQGGARNAQEQRRELAECRNYIEAHFQELKDAYTYLLSTSRQWGGIDVETSVHFFQKECQFSESDEAFIRTQFELATEVTDFYKKRDKDKDPELLCRKEFFEMFIRIGRAEYPELTVSRALERAYAEHIQSVIPSEACENGRLFREQELWTSEVNNLLVANEAGLARVCALYCNPLTFECLEKMFMVDSRPRLVQHRQDLIRAAALAKLPIACDFEPHNVQLAQFSRGEFYEVLARVVDIRSADTALGNVFLHKKIEAVLDQVLHNARLRGNRPSTQPWRRTQSIHYHQADEPHSLVAKLAE